MICVVCHGNSISPFGVFDSKQYWKCASCLAAFLDKAHHLSSTAEKSFYLTHENRVDDPAYRNFLSRLSEPLKAKLSGTEAGLDYGCGPGPALADMFEQNGFRMDIYDPFFCPNHHVFAKKYDFISCTEAAEHFFDPFKEFNTLNDLLETGGWLGVMTSFLKSDDLFENWHYRRDPTHVVFYATETFEVIAAQRNWSCEIKSESVVLFHKKT